MKQDDFMQKPTSIVADFSKIKEAVENAVQGKQLEPLFL